VTCRSPIGRLLGILLCLLPAAAFAHAIVLEALPDVEATVAGPTVEVALRFNSRIDQRRSRLTLFGPDSAPRVLPIVTANEPAVLRARADGVPPGAYTLRWQVLAEDGHITRGDIPFKVGR
jgi:methionine-rich copper-binding protein CopC